MRVVHGNRGAALLLTKNSPGRNSFSHKKPVAHPAKVGRIDEILITMSTQNVPAEETVVVPASAPVTGLEPEIKIYSHSTIFYWWPVWVVGFVMAALTYFDGS